MRSSGSCPASPRSRPTRPHEEEHMNTTRETMLEHLRRFLEEERAIPPERVTEDAAFRDDLEIDSLDLAEIAMELEDVAATRFEDGAVSRIVTVGDALDYATGLAARQSAAT